MSDLDEVIIRMVHEANIVSGDARFVLQEQLGFLARYVWMSLWEACVLGDHGVAQSIGRDSGDCYGAERWRWFPRMVETLLPCEAQRRGLGRDEQAVGGRAGNIQRTYSKLASTT